MMSRNTTNETTTEIITPPSTPKALDEYLSSGALTIDLKYSVIKSIH